MIEPQTHTSSTGASSDVTAAFFWPAPNRAPEVTLSFYGTNEPVALWVSLRVLGWIVPNCPPPPRTAIEWVPDPRTGADHTIHPWIVKDFRLQPGTWTREEERAVGAFTINAFRAYNVSMTGLRTEDVPPEAVTPPALAAPATEPPTPETATPAAAGWTPVVPARDHASPNPPTPQHERPATAARVLLVAPAVAGELELPGGVAGVPAHRGREQALWAWGESTDPIHQIFENPADFDAIISAGGYAWTAAPETAPPPNGSTAVVQVVIPGASAGDKKVGKILKMVGGAARTIELEPVGPGEAAVLLSIEAPAHSAEMLTSNLRLRLPHGIVCSGRPS